MSLEDKIKLEYISPELYVSKSVAVVGSSKILLDNEWGEEIDSHDDEANHVEADKLLIEFLKAINCKRLAAAWEEIGPKWYS